MFPFPNWFNGLIWLWRLPLTNFAFQHSFSFNLWWYICIITKTCDGGFLELNKFPVSCVKLCKTSIQLTLWTSFIIYFSEGLGKSSVIIHFVCLFSYTVHSLFTCLMLMPVAYLLDLFPQHYLLLYVCGLSWLHPDFWTNVCLTILYSL